MKSRIEPKGNERLFKYPGLQVHLPTGVVILFSDVDVEPSAGTVVWAPAGTSMLRVGDRWNRIAPSNYAPYNGKVILEN